MKKQALTSFLILSMFIFGTQNAFGTQCTDLAHGFLQGGFSITHSDASSMKVLQSVSFHMSQTHKESNLKLRNGESMTVFESYSINSKHFNNTANLDQKQSIDRFDTIYIASFSKSPDLCFVLWTSSQNTDLVNANAILGDDASGNLQLGSNNKLDLSVHMTLTRQ